MLLLWGGAACIAACASLQWIGPSPWTALLLGPSIGVALFLVLERSPRMRLSNIRELSAQALFWRSSFMLGNTVAEEVVWRGLILEATIPYLGTPFAAIVNAVLFGLYHWPYMGSRAATMHAFTGLVFCAIYQISGTLLYPILAHLTYNLFLVGRTSRPRSA
jgi:membrane protease YdiL (CAAX protease family)